MDNEIITLKNKINELENEIEVKDAINKALKARINTSSQIIEQKYEIDKLERMLAQERNNNNKIYANLLKKMKEFIDFREDIVKLCKNYAITFMRFFKDYSLNNSPIDEMQGLVNKFIFEITHVTYEKNL